MNVTATNALSALRQASKHLSVVHQEAVVRTTPTGVEVDAVPAEEVKPPRLQVPNIRPHLVKLESADVVLKDAEADRKAAVEAFKSHIEVPKDEKVNGTLLDLVI